MRENTRLFIQGLASRLSKGVQISSDAFALYAPIQSEVKYHRV
jgi:hypothetical protein